MTSKKRDQDQGKDDHDGEEGPLFTSPDDEVTHQVQTLYDRLRKTCLYQFEEQHLSAQIISALLLEVASEVTGEWWADEMTEFFESIGKDDQEGDEDEDEDQDLGL